MYTAIIPGDVNGDGKIKMYDAFSILRNVLFNTGTMSQIDILISDFDNDGKVKMQDAFSYLKQALFEWNKICKLGELKWVLEQKKY